MSIETESAPEELECGALVVRGARVAIDSKEDAGGASGALDRGSALSFAGLWAGVTSLAPDSKSSPHHHGPQATIIFVLSGQMSVVITDGGGQLEIGPGDFAAVPAGVVHWEENASDEPCRSVVVRTGETPVVVAA
jgi:uncharacterized RmlC-like cupin family protein